jgi:aminoglycoside phosphotransferase (APT) family kinase protein
VSERIHDDELDTSQPTVRALLVAQCPEWSGLPLSSVRRSGTSNAMWRVHLPSGSDLVVRLPRRAAFEGSILQELELLPMIADGPLAGVVRTPNIRHSGAPTEAFRHPWAVLDWIDGADAWSARQELTRAPDALDALAADLARVVQVTGELGDLPVPCREPGSRGGPLEPLLDRLDRWLADPRWHASDLLDMAMVKRRADESREASGAPATVGFVHGDLIPGNLLVSRGRLSAIIDWGGAGYGDLAEDLISAWAVLDERSRRRFRKKVGVSDATWLRARAFALEQAVGGVLYYTPRRHPLAEVMARTLHRILDEG